MRSMSAQDVRKLQQQIPGGQFIEGSNAGNAASDAADRAENDPAVESPLKGQSRRWWMQFTGISARIGHAAVSLHHADCIVVNSAHSWRSGLSDGRYEVKNICYTGR